MREFLCHNAQWLRAMHITFVVAFAFLRVLSSLPSFLPSPFPLSFPVIHPPIHIRSLFPALLLFLHMRPRFERVSWWRAPSSTASSLTCPEDKGPEKQPSNATCTVIRGSLSISKIACVPHVHRTISRRTLRPVLMYVVLLYGTLSISSAGTPVLLFFSYLLSAQPAFSVFLRNYCTTHARLITLQTFASHTFSLFLFLSLLSFPRDSLARIMVVSTDSQRHGKRKKKERQK